MSSDHFLTCCDVIEESKYNQLLFPCVSMHTVQGEQSNTVIFDFMSLQKIFLTIKCTSTDVIRQRELKSILDLFE